MWKQYLIGGVISLAAIWMFLEMVDVSEMALAFSEMNPVWLLPCALIYLVSYMLRAVRWHYLMRPVARVPFMPLFKALMLGFLGNNLLPAHLGEFIRAVFLGQNQGVSKSATFATIVLERVCDGLTVLVFLLMVLLFLDLPEGEVEGSVITLGTLRVAGWWGLAFFGGILIVLQLFRYHNERACRLVGFCLKPAPVNLAQKVVAMVESFGDGLRLAKGCDLLWTGFYSLLVWIALAAWAWSLFPAFGLELNFMAGVLLQVVIALAILIPTAPAFIGAFHLAAAATLAFMGVDGGKAGSFAMVLWLVHVVVTSLIGFYYAWRHGFALFSFGKKEQDEAA